MLGRIQRSLYKLKKLLLKVHEKDGLEEPSALASLSRRKTVEERREEAVTFIIEKYFDLKKREEDYLRKLESYGRFRRWIFEKSRSLRTAGMIFKETVVKPSIIVMMVFSCFFSIWLGTVVGQPTTKFTQTYVPFPFNYALDVLILFPIGFAPGILSIVLSYYWEKKKLLRLFQDYGV
ncbi:MAG: hypothetical protein OEY22_01910 [Candidatus Bathyarchaeota archaeon]|nr:hypothetical protein [Candidatus Bathyarchaeota archaeon]